MNVSVGFGLFWTALGWFWAIVAAFGNGDRTESLLCTALAIGAWSYGKAFFKEAEISELRKKVEELEKP